MVLRPQTLVVHVPADGTPVPLLHQTGGKIPFVIRATCDIRIGSQDSLSSDNGLLIFAGSLFGMGAADYGDGVNGQMYVCCADGNGGKVTGMTYTEDYA